MSAGAGDRRSKGAKRPSVSRSTNGPLRRIALGGEEIDYRLERATGGSIVMEIGLSGLTVRAPRWATIRQIEAALRERTPWILRTLEQWRARRRPVLPSEWRSGEPILYQGTELALTIQHAPTQTISTDMFHLIVRHPSPDDESSIAAFVIHWLKEEAMRALAPRLARFAARVSAATPALKLSNARNEWGSCNRNGEIRLNWRLVHLPPNLADYIVAHEVAHLVELNHSQRFWALVETLFPGHADARRALDDWTALLEA